MALPRHSDRGERERTGGAIAALGDVAAFRLSGRKPSPMPVLIAVAHAGRAYPPALLDRMRHPQLTALRLEDRYADRLAAAVARASGARLLVAEAPRALIDLNRDPADVDWTMIARPPAPVPPAAVGARARSGLGVIPRRLPGLGELWRGLIDRAELEQRIAEVHAPYHAALAAELAALRRQWGAALLVDLHSMPPLPREGASAAAEYVVGDRFGASADGAVTAAAFAHFASETRRAGHNRPYAGGYGIARHGVPREHLHALQIEVDRASYLDAKLEEPGAGFVATAQGLGRLVCALGDVVATLGARRGGGWAEAAE